MFGSVLGVLVSQAVSGGLPLVAWVSMWTSRWLTISLGYSYPAHPVGRTDCRSKVMWLEVNVPITPLEILHGLRRWLTQALYPSLLRVLVPESPHIFLEVSIVLGFLLFPVMLPVLVPVVSRCTLSLQPDSFCSHPQFTGKVFFISASEWDSCVPS